MYLKRLNSPLEKKKLRSNKRAFEIWLLKSVSLTFLVEPLSSSESQTIINSKTIITFGTLKTTYYVVQNHKPNIGF